MARPIPAWARGQGILCLVPLGLFSWLPPPPPLHSSPSKQMPCRGGRWWRWRPPQQLPRTPGSQPAAAPRPTCATHVSALPGDTLEPGPSAAEQRATYR